jgi:hypothetical protein
LRLKELDFTSFMSKKQHTDVSTERPEKAINKSLELRNPPTVLFTLKIAKLIPLTIIRKIVKSEKKMNKIITVNNLIYLTIAYPDKAKP